jgi:hypothetical protein
VNSVELEANPELTVEHPSALPAAFNSTAGVPRLVLLVSPTCSVCLDGVRIVVDALGTVGAQGVAIHVVWVAVLDDDGLEAATAAAAMFPTYLQATHYWDGQLQVSNAFHASLRLKRWKRKVAWDICLLYDSGSNWASRPPAPSLWMQQLGIEDVPGLDGSLLVRHLSELSVD